MTHTLSVATSINGVPIQYPNEGVRVPCFVSVICHNRAYGGPEEGGWWYSTAERIEAHYCATEAALIAVSDHLFARYSNVGRRELSSVLCEGRYEFVVDREPRPLFDPLQRPHYE